ncbi:uroporphyrinogen-III C-methyltransferase [Candidatus Aminicenantes bacterium AC-708-M15]|jgi:uroporphyrinogen III methyltransferase/synthase|nr:uroporphyrinogen-III C-methyltransferase [SCandidatus Aminicenantes bacterium Aminicenantia_JdfR_composite]MCP2604031.1 uroporphyrinogen-III C-methyltransferase [Candidatus Aminicenantes bacterium AC-708-M15]
MNKGKVYLIGAGPGDPELISIKGLKYLKRADVVIYDNLVNKKLLKNVKNGAEIIYVGKESGHHTLDQEEINKLLIKKAKEGKVVVRLKGGDPFIFGRGGEEALALSENNIEFEIIPGITAATAVPAYAGIPVTHREITSTLAFITGHETPLKEKSHIDWSKISTGIGTLVFFMGIKNLKNIINNLIRHGRDENTPVAIIRWGTLPEQKVITGNLKNIVQIAEKENIKPPAIIIVGDVVKLRDKLNWYESKPLFGKKIVVTRSRSQASKLVELLEEYGAKTIEIPTIRFEYLEESYSLTTAINQIKKFDWLIFTSINGVKSFFKRFFSLKKDIRELANIKIATIGPATKNEIESLYIKVDFQPSKYFAECFVEEFIKKNNIKNKNILLIHADKARDYIEKELVKFGANVTSVIGYRTLSENLESSKICEILEQGEIDWVTFTSSTTVKNFFNIYKGQKRFKIASIGPITSKTIKEFGFSPDVEAEEYTIPGLVKAILNYYRG